MNYEVVELEEKTLVGVSAVTSNSSPDMGAVIGGLWSKLYQDGIGAKIKNKKNEYAIGLYSDYEGESYQVTVGNEVTRAENAELTQKTIKAGKYAKFSIQGHMQMAVAKAWEEIWKMDLDRSYTGDFEEYLNADFENAKVDIYIALK